MKLFNIKFICFSFFLFIIHTTSAQVVKIYEQNIDSNTITTILESPKVNFPILESQDQHYLHVLSVLFSDTKIAKERIFGITNKSILSYDRINQKINRYDFNLNLIRSLKIDEFEYPTFLLGANGNFIVTDEYEAAGTFVKIYSENLDLINSFHPFGRSFFQIIFNSSNDSLTALLTVPETKERHLKIFLINNKKGEIISEEVLPYKKLNVFSSLLVKDHLAISSFRKLSLVNFMGKVVWENSFLPHATPEPFYFDEHKGFIYGYNYANGILYGFDLKNGDEAIKKNLENQLNTSSGKVVPYFIDFMPLTKKIVMHLRKNKYTTNSKLLMFNDEGELEVDLFLDESMENAYTIINPDANQILLITKQKIQVYEVF